MTVGDGPTVDGAAHPLAGDFRSLPSERRVVVSCGAGGVGKTTTAAAIALEAARRGRRACVVTVDPARRLADALGITVESDDLHRVEGDWPGELWAVMLDAKGTFDALVRRYAPSEEQAEAILANRLYRNLASSLSGTQEYMAAEKLFELHEREDLDLVVVDTPPTRHALDFLDAPGRLTRLLENRVFRALVSPSRTPLRLLGIGVRTLLRSIAAVVGREVVDDTVGFFQAFEGMEEGFRLRARRVEALLADPATAFVLVTTPDTSSLEEAGWFAERLATSGHRAEWLVVNRAHPGTSDLLRLVAATPEEAASGCPSSRPDAEPPTPPAATDRALLESLEANARELELAHRRELASLAASSPRLGQLPRVVVPLLGSDVHDIAGLEEIAAALFG